jgi:hypothetical protein
MTNTENLEQLTLSEMADRYNTLAPILDKDVITKFRDKSTGLRRLQQLYIELESRNPTPVTETKTRKKRQKVFMYPPLSEGLKEIAPNSLRARARDLLIKGATFAQIEDVIRVYDVEKGKKSSRISERAYGLIRLLHTYVGYGLREEGEGDAKLIYVVTLEQRKVKVEPVAEVVVTKVTEDKKTGFLSESDREALKDGYF